MPEVNNLFQLIKSAQNILIVFKGNLLFDDINNFLSLHSYLSSLNTSYKLLCVDKQEEKNIQIAKDRGLDVITELKPSEFVVTIDYASSGVEKVVYDTDKENGKLIFKIVPSKAGFSFDKVEFNEGGGKYDSTIMVGIYNPKDLGEFYDQNEYLFKESAFISLKDSSAITDAFCTTEEVLPKSVVDSVMKNTLQSVNIVDGYPDKDKLSKIISLFDMGGDLSNAIQEKYYSKEEKYIEVFKELFVNIVKSGDVIYSFVRKSKLIDFSIEDVKQLGRIPFNVVGKYKLALAFFELSDEKVYLIVESNDINKYSASTIAGVFDGEGDMGHAFCKVDDMSFEDINRRFWPILKDLYNVDITTKADSKDVDNLPKVLTKGRRNSKNRGLTK